MPDETQSDETTIYPSLAAKGHVLIQLPQPDLRGIEEGFYQRSDMRQQGQTDRFHAADFGEFVCGAVERAFAQRGPISAAYTLSHYVEHGKAVLLDTHAAAHLKKLSGQMAASSNPQRVFAEIAVYLRSLQPRAR